MTGTVEGDYMSGPALFDLGEQVIRGEWSAGLWAGGNYRSIRVVDIQQLEGGRLDPLRVILVGVGVPVLLAVVYVGLNAH